jgi:hypothetical protein
MLCIGVQIFWNGASALLGSLAHQTHKQSRIDGNLC